MDLKQLKKPQEYFDSMMSWAVTAQQHHLHDFILEKLAIQGNERILEVGFGSGEMLEKVSELLTPQAELWGIDRDERMFEQAYHRNRSAIEIKRLQLVNTCLWDFKTPEEYYDIIYANNVHTDWENPVTEFRFLRELLVEGGKFLLVFCLQASTLEDDTSQAVSQVVAQYQHAGFEQMDIDYRLVNGNRYISVVAYK